MLAVVGYAAFELTGHVTQPGPTAAHASRTPRAAPESPGGQSATFASPAPGTTPSARPVPGGPQARPLTPVRAEAFGPNGTADGDNPQLAPNVFVSPAAGWRTQWYASAQFGMLKPGTGLLLDMGATVVVTGVTVRLGPRPGAVLELRVAREPDPSAFRTVAAVTAASDVASLTRITPVRARYVLLWCTRLPPTGTGTYQLIVHRVTVEGYPQPLRLTAWNRSSRG